MSRLYAALLAALFAACCSATPGSAQEVPILTWDAVASRASSNPANLTAQARLQAAQAGVSEARQYPNPELGLRRGRLNALAGSRSDPVSGIEVGLPLESPLLRSYRKRAAAAGLEAVRWETEAVRLATMRDLRLLYLTVSRDQALTDAQTTALDHLAGLVQGVAVRVAQGEARRIELVRLEGEQAEARAEAQTVRADAVANRQRLALWLGPDVPVDFRVDLSLEILPSLPPLQTVRSTVRERHPVRQAMQAEVGRAQARLGLARQAALPGLVLGGSYEREEGTPTYAGTLGLVVPLWNWNRGGIAIAKAERQGAVHQVELAERELEDEARRLYGRASGVLLAVEQYTSRILPNSTAVLNAVERSYQTGETSLLDLLDARRQAVRTRIDYLDRLLEYWSLWTELNTMMGSVSYD